MSLARSSSRSDDRPLVGVHVAAKDPLRSTVEEGAEVVQVHLANPQAWRAPRPRADVEALRASLLPLSVQAPYLLNLATPDAVTWERSVMLLGQVLTVASSVGADLGMATTARAGGVGP